MRGLESMACVIWSFVMGTSWTIWYAIVAITVLIEFRVESAWQKKNVATGIFSLAQSSATEWQIEVFPAPAAP